jgi:hypothetical protein
MLTKLLRMPRGGPDVEVGVAIPIGCLAPVALAIAVLVGIGVVATTRLQEAAPVPTAIVVRVIDDGAQGGPQVVSTQIVPLR